jgi:hypothetical protein
MSMKKPGKSMSNAPMSGPRQRQGDGAIHVPPEVRRRLAAAAAYFRTARRRNTGAAGFHADDRRAAAVELEELLRRCHVKF